MSSMVVDNAPATVKGKPRHPIRPRSSYRTMKRRQPFGGFSDRNAYFSDDVVAASQQVAANGKQRSDKSIYEKTLQMLMKAGQAAFDQNNIDDDEQMQEERVDVIATEVDHDNSRNERHTRTLEYYFRPKEAHK